MDMPILGAKTAPLRVTVFIAMVYQQCNRDAAVAEQDLLLVGQAKGFFEFQSRAR